MIFQDSGRHKHKATIRPLNNENFFNPFHATDLFRCPLKTSENLWFSDVSKGYQKRSGAWNGLSKKKKTKEKNKNIVNLELILQTVLGQWVNTNTSTKAPKNVLATYYSGLNIDFEQLVIHMVPVLFYSPRNKKTRVFPIFLGGIEREQQHKIA